MAVLTVFSIFSARGASADEGETLAEANAALQRRDYVAAERFYRQALKVQPQSFEVLNNLAISLYLEGKAEAAIQYFQMALKQKYSLVTLAFLVNDKCRMRDVEGAQPLLAKIKSQHVKDPQALALLAPCFLESGDPIEATRAYEILKTSDGFAKDEMRIRLGKAYLAAAQFFFGLLQNAPNNAEYVAAIRKARELGSPNARGALELALKQSPYLRADIGFTDAVQLWRQHPRDAGVLYLLSVLSGEAAMREVVACEEKYPQSPWLEQFRADMLANQGDQESAVEKYEELIRRHPDLPGLRHDLAELYTKRNQWDKALLLFQREEAEDPNDEWASAGVSESLLGLNKYEAAKVYLTSRFAESKAPLWALMDLATAQEQLGNQQDAIKALMAAEKRSPADKRIHYRLMRLYFSAGNKSEAERENVLFQKSQ